MNTLPSSPSASRQWAALRLTADARLHDDLIINVVGPFLEAAGRQAPTQGHVLRNGQIGAATLRLRLQSELSPPALLRLFREALDRWPLAPACVAEPVEDLGFPQLDEIYQGAAVPQIFENFACDTSGLLVEYLSLVTRGAPRLTIAFDLMVAHLVAVNRNLYPGARELPYPTSFLSLRSHADGFFIMCRDPVHAKRTLEDRYLRQADRMQARLLALLRQFTRQAPAMSESAAHWAACIDQWMARASTASELGGLQTGPSPGVYLGDSHDISISEFHQEIQRRPAIQAMMSADIQVHSMRMTFSCLYFFLHQLGVRLVERYLLCHAISRSIEDAFDVNPSHVLELVADLGARRAASADRRSGAAAPDRTPGPAHGDAGQQ
jgi:hypothetical protein